jgi:hypothetical protein
LALAFAECHQLRRQLSQKKQQVFGKFADDSIVEGILEPVLDLQPGEPVVVVTYSDETARLTHGEVIQFQPLVVRMPDFDPSAVLGEERAMLIVKGRTPEWFARTTIKSWSLDKGTALLTFEETPWELEDRRKFPRVALQVPVKLRLVHEQPGSLTFTEAEGTTEDLSLGGASVKMHSPVPVGMLVEFRSTAPNEQPIRCLAVVLHTDADSTQLGIEFVNFMGDGRSALSKLLEEAA